MNWCRKQIFAFFVHVYPLLCNSNLTVILNTLACACAHTMNFTQGVISYDGSRLNSLILCRMVFTICHNKNHLSHANDLRIHNFETVLFTILLYYRADVGSTYCDLWLTTGNESDYLIQNQSHLVSVSVSAAVSHFIHEIRKCVFITYPFKNSNLLLL